jgi:dienelactone hydrolase
VAICEPGVASVLLDGRVAMTRANDPGCARDVPPRARIIARVLGLGLAGLMSLVPAARAERFQPAVFDLDAARDPRDLEAAEVAASRHVTDGVTVREVRFTSRAWDAHGRSRPIRIQGFLAVPPGVYPPHTKPVVITAPGLGAHATPEAAGEICRNLDVVALAISAPGAGASEGEGVTPADARALFATVPDVRGSWLYAYTYALLRAITFAQQQPEADPQAVVLTGNSIAGVAILVANGVDDRVRGVLAVSTSGDLARATSAGSWLKRLVQSAGELKPDSREVRALYRALDPLAFAAQQHGAVYLLTGAQDEFFPLGQAVSTYRALEAPAKSLAIVADYDHGWYFGYGCPAHCMPGYRGDEWTRPVACPTAPVCPTRCPAQVRPPYCGPQVSYNNQDAFIGRWSALLRALVAHHAARPPRPFVAPPPPPTVERRARQVIVRPVGPVPHAVRLAISDNGGYTYGQFVLARHPDGTYRLHRRVSPAAILIAEVELESNVVATAVPDLPPRFRARVRQFGEHP